jgi:tetratricopeptide (TPR) repeat protein
MNATGPYDEALELGRRALEIALRDQDAYGEVLARSAIGRNLLMLRRSEDALECLSAAREVIERNGYDAIKANIIGAIATAMARTGHAREAIGQVEAVLQSEMQLRTGQAELCQLHAGYAEALVRAGEAVRGMQALDRALAIAKSIKNPWLIVECLCLRAGLLTETRPDDKRIDQDISEARAICDQSGLASWDMSRRVA